VRGVKTHEVEVNFIGLRFAQQNRVKKKRIGEQRSRTHRLAGPSAHALGPVGQKMKKAHLFSLAVEAMLERNDVAMIHDAHDLQLAVLRRDTYGRRKREQQQQDMRERKRRTQAQAQAAHSKR
jgi:hypothetical protein